MRLLHCISTIQALASAQVATWWIQHVLQRGHAAGHYIPELWRLLILAGGVSSDGCHDKYKILGSLIR